MKISATCGGRSSLPNNANSPSFPTVPAPTKNFRKDIAPLSQILMLKASPDRLVHVGAPLRASGFLFLEPTGRRFLGRPETCIDDARAHVAALPQCQISQRRS